jgi:phage tail tape-measure protein
MFLLGSEYMANENIGSLIVSIEANLRNFETGMNTVQSRLQGINNTMDRTLRPTIKKIEGAFKAVGTAAVVGLGGLLTAGIKGAANMEQYKNTLITLTGSAEEAGKKLAWAADFANRTPFETSAIVDATTKLISYGLEAEKVLPQIGDMAAVMGKDINQAVEAIADAQSGELERLKEFGITKQQIIDHAASIMKGKEIVNNQGQITDQEAFNTALFSLMDTRFKGGMERQASSFKGLWSTITSTFETSMMAIVGVSASGEVKIGGIFDRMRTAIKNVADKLDKMQKDGTIQKWADEVQKKFDESWPTIVKVFDGIISFGQWTIDHWSEIVEGIKAIIAAYLVFKTVEIVILAVEMAIKLATAAQWLFNAAMLANPIADVIIAIGLIGAALALLVINWDKITGAIEKAWNWLTKWNSTPAKNKEATAAILTPGAATNAPTSLGGASKNVTGFATGINRVPMDMLAKIHKDEAIIPAKNNPFNPNASNAMGGSINITVENMSVRNDNDIKMIAREIFNLTTARNRGSGVIPAT